MSAIVRANRDVDVTEGDFAKKLREALEQGEERGGEIAIRQERPDLSEWEAAQPAVNIEAAQPAVNIELTLSFLSPVTFDMTIFGKSVY